VTLSRFPRTADPGSSTEWTPGGADRSVVSLVTEMVMLPMTALLYGMELLVRAVQGFQHATLQGVDVLAGGALPAREAPAPRDADGEAGHNQPITTRGNAGDPEPRPAHQEVDAMDQSICHESRRDRDLRDDMLKLVRYKILFVKREYEVAFPEQEDLVEDNMDPTSFAAWKVAEFIQHLHRDGTDIPSRWRDRNYPSQDKNDKGDYKYYHSDGRRLMALPEHDKKYLRVYYEVLDRYPREKFKHDEQQIRVLEQIRDNIEELNKP
jgi:hypothetical protein